MSRSRQLLYSHDGLGLGHFRRTLAIATELARLRPDVSQLAIASTSDVFAFAIPSTVDVLRIPGLSKQDLFDTDDNGTNDLFSLREAVLESTFVSYGPDIILVDHEPDGLAGELRDLLYLLHNKPNRPRLVLGMRDITYAPAEVIDTWTRDNVFSLLEEVYDQILIYGDPKIFDPIAEYRLSPRIAQKVTFTGYIAGTPRHAIDDIRQKLHAEVLPLVVVSVGGGIDGANLIRAYLEMVQLEPAPSFMSYIVAGPQMPPPQLKRLRAAAGTIPNVMFDDFHDDVLGLYRAADVVVSMAGYNSVSEALSVGKRPLLVPRSRDTFEQVIRAERMSARGLVQMIAPSDLSAQRLRTEVETALATCISAVPELDLSGGGRVASELSTFLPYY